MPPVIRPARGRRQVYLNGQGHMVVMSPELDKQLYKIEPMIHEGSPTLRVTNGAGQEVLMLSVSTFRTVVRYLPVLFNSAERLTRSTTRLNRANVGSRSSAVVNTNDEEG